MSNNKRKAQYELDQNNLSDEEHAGPDLGKISTPEEIAQRRILKVKGPKSEESTTPAKLVLLTKLDETQPIEVKEDSTKATSDATNGDKKEAEKKIEFKAQSSLFGNLNGNNQIEKKEDAPKPASTSLFGNLPPTSGLFSNAGGSLFSSSGTSSSLFGNTSNNGTGLFASIKKDEGSAAVPNIFSTEKPAGSLFGNMSTPTTSLFANAKTPDASSLFGNLQKNTAASGGLFSKKEGSDDEGDEGDGEDDDELEHSPEIDPSKIEMKYQYNNPYEKIVDKAVLKCRKGEGDILEKGYISLEKFKADEKIPHILVYRDQIKKVIFTLSVLKKINKVEKIGNATKNLKFVFYKKTDEKLVPEFIKIQFHDEKEGEEFFNKYKEYVDN